VNPIDVSDRHCGVSYLSARRQSECIEVDIYIKIIVNLLIYFEKFSHNYDVSSVFSKFD
jgi:hypothetical protein